MTGNHCVHPSPAYNPKGKLIHPTQYKQSLKGVLAIMHFSLKSWSFNAYDTANVQWLKKLFKCLPVLERLY